MKTCTKNLNFRKVFQKNTANFLKIQLKIALELLTPTWEKSVRNLYQSLMNIEPRSYAQ